jgi:hypothetical protein
MIDEPTEPTMRAPRVFGIWGTLAYGIASMGSICTVLSIAIFNRLPPWWIISSAFMYVFISAGIIFFGRIEANREAKFFLQALKRQSEINEMRQMRKMN